MTISSTNRKAGPYLGNDVTVAFPFAFKVFAASDLYVVRSDSSGNESPMSLGTDYTVALNANQDSTPGGTLTLPAALETGASMVITSGMENLQPTDLTNQGGFYPKVINNALDRVTILVQQIAEQVKGALKFPIGEATSSSELPSITNRAGKILSFNDAGEPIALSYGGNSYSAGDINFIPSGTGAVATDVQSKLRESVSVKDFGAVGDGSDQTLAFNKAAAASPMVRVTAGNYLISAPTTPDTVWVLDAGAVITGLPDLDDSQTPTTSINNTSRLTGRIFRYQNTANGAGILVGDSDPWMEQYIRPSSLSRAEFSAVSPYGQIAITGASKTSDNPITTGTDMACIGGNFYAINDREQQPGEVLTAYAIYAEARRRPSGGAAYGMEIDIANQDSAVPCTPNSPLSYAEYNGGIIVNSGAGLDPSSLYSASFGMLFGSNGDNFLRGIVFNDGAVDSSTLEAVSMPLHYKLAWYEGGNSVCHLDNRNHQRKINTDTAGIGVEDNNIRARASYANSESLDVIYKSTSFGWLSGGAYQGAFTRVLQRSAFSASNARFSFDIDAKNANGTSAQVSLNGTADNTFSPGSSDNVLNLGGPSFRWSVVYAGTGTINTSDEREKTFIDIDSAEIAVANELKTVLRKFKFNDAIEEKGIENARIHFGIGAQTVVAIFAKHGLDATKYALLCYDEWDEQEEVKDEDGNVIQEYRAAGNRYGIRYDELLAFIISVL